MFRLHSFLEISVVCFPLHPQSTVGPCVFTLCALLSCRVARVCEELRSLVGVPHAGLAAPREERPCGSLWGCEEGPVLPTQGDGPVPGVEGLWGPPALRRSPEGRKLQAIGAAQTWIRPLHSWDASEHQRTDQNSRHCVEEKEHAWSTRWIHAKMIYVIPSFPFWWDCQSSPPSLPVKMVEAIETRHPTLFPSPLIFMQLFNYFFIFCSTW